MSVDLPSSTLPAVASRRRSIASGRIREYDPFRRPRPATCLALGARHLALAAAGPRQAHTYHQYASARHSRQRRPVPLPDYAPYLRTCPPAHSSIWATARAGPGCAAAHAATARARSAAPRRARARRTASRTPHGVQKRKGSRTPSPAQSTRAAFSAMSPPAGQMTTGQPDASARTRVPWPPWQTTRSQRGMVWEYETQGTTTAFAGGEATSPIAITRTGSSARPSSAARTSRPSRSCEVEGATSTTGPEPSTGETSGPGGSHINGPTTFTHGSQSRGYSSCGSAPTSVKERDNPVCTQGNGASP